MNDYRNGSISNGGSVTSSLAGFAIGAVVGASLALLLAPESGKRTRQRLATTAQKLGQTAGEKLDQAKSAVQEFGSDAKTAIKAGKEAFLHDRSQRSDSRMGQGQGGSQGFGRSTEEATH